MKHIKSMIMTMLVVLLALPASADCIVGVLTAEDLENAGLSSTKTEIAGGTVILDNEAGTLSLAYDDEWGTIYGYGTYSYRSVIVGDSGEITLNRGAVGETNPVFVSYEAGVMSAGAVFKLEAKQAGWMTVLLRMSADKQYVVFENKTEPLPYTLGMASTDLKINYSLPVLNDGLINFNSPEASKYFTAATKQKSNENGVPLWTNADGDVVASRERPEGGEPVMEEVNPRQNVPQFPYIVADIKDTSLESGHFTGFLTFEVLEGNTYYFSALGSRVGCSGFIFTDSEAQPTVTFPATDELPEVLFDSVMKQTSLEAAGTEFEYMGIRYAVLDPTARTCKVIAPNQVGGGGYIPSEAKYGFNEYTVVEIDAEGFAGSVGLSSISLPSTVRIIGKGAFSGCERLTSLIWRGDSRMPTEVVEAIENPNLLVYVDSVRFAPESLDHNVVADGICQNLVLTPGYPFTPVSDFTAKSSSMTKEFTQQTAFDGCAGWETIVLPFNVTRVTGPDGKAVIPFAAATDTKRQRPFWLYEADPAGEWKEAAEMKAGVPYIISMPNNPRYNPAYNISGEVTFANSNPQKITAAKPDTVTWTTGRQFRGLWMPLSTGEAEGALGLNVNATVVEDGHEYAPGSAFVAGVTPKPFEAYVTRNGTARAFPIRGAQNAVLTLVSDRDGLTISQEGSMVMLRSDADRTVDIHSADGTLLRRVNLKAGQTAYVESLPQGILLIAGRKLMVY